MPLYEYECSKCKKTFEVIEKFSDEPLKKHQGCGGKVHRMMSAPAFHLKGSGWYVTDYGKKDVKKDSSESKPKETSSSDSSTETSKAESSSSSSESKSENKSSSDAKPAEKSEKKSKKTADSKK